MNRPMTPANPTPEPMDQFHTSENDKKNQIKSGHFMISSLEDPRDKFDFKRGSDGIVSTKILIDNQNSPYFMGGIKIYSSEVLSLTRIFVLLMVQVSLMGKITISPIIAVGPTYSLIFSLDFIQSIWLSFD